MLPAKLPQQGTASLSIIRDKQKRIWVETKNNEYIENI